MSAIIATMATTIGMARMVIVVMQLFCARSAESKDGVEWEIPCVRPTESEDGVEWGVPCARSAMFFGDVVDKTPCVSDMGNIT